MQLKFGELMGWAYTDSGKIVLAGALGGLVRWVTLRNSWTEGISSMVVGGICALYLGPLITPLLEPVIGSIAPDGDAQGFASFVTGLGGISISGILIDIINTRRESLTDEEDKNGKDGS